MRTIFILFGIIFLHLNKVQSIHNYFPAESARCGKELGYSIDSIRTAVRANHMKIGCITACIFNRFGGMKEGRYIFTSLMEILESLKTAIPNYPQLKEAIEICYPEVAEPRGRTECELGLIFSRCISKYDKYDASST